MYISASLAQQEFIHLAKSTLPPAHCEVPLLVILLYKHPLASPPPICCSVIALRVVAIANEIVAIAVTPRPPPSSSLLPFPLQRKQYPPPRKEGTLQATTEPQQWISVASHF